MNDNVAMNAICRAMYGKTSCSKLRANDADQRKRFVPDQPDAGWQRDSSLRRRIYRWPHRLDGPGEIEPVDGRRDFVIDGARFCSWNHRSRLQGLGNLPALALALRRWRGSGFSGDVDAGGPDGLDQVLIIPEPLEFRSVPWIMEDAHHIE